MTTITIDRELLEKIRRLTERGMSIGDRSALFNELTAILKTTQATAPAQPAWHDAPTVPGVWICDEGDICYTWTAHNIEILDQFDPGDGLRWYGPIPEDRQ